MLPERVCEAEILRLICCPSAFHNLTKSRINWQPNNPQRACNYTLKVSSGSFGATQYGACRSGGTSRREIYFGDFRSQENVSPSFGLGDYVYSKVRIPDKDMILELGRTVQAKNVL